MTCIVALKHNGKVYFGADSLASSNGFAVVRNDKKIFKIKDFLFGFTTSYRMGQLIQHKFNPPEHLNEIDTFEYLTTIFIDKIREVLKDGGFASKNNEVEAGGQFLVGYKGRIFNIYSDYQVSESKHDFDACGSGVELALGSLYSTENRSPFDRINLALFAAQEFGTYVRGPFHYLEI